MRPRSAALGAVFCAAASLAIGCGGKREEAPRVSSSAPDTEAEQRARMVEYADRRARRARSPRARGDAQGAAPPLRRGVGAEPGLRGPPRSDREQPDDLAAVHRRPDDGAARAAAEGPRPRDRDGIGLPERRPRRDRVGGLLDRDPPGARAGGRPEAEGARLLERRGPRGRRLPRLDRARALRRHHRDRGPRAHPAAARSTSSPWAAAW